MGVLTAFSAIDADQEIGATKRGEEICKRI
jgi:hypothetical protein